MAKGKKTGGKDFPKGRSGNPGGFTQEQAQKRRLTRERFIDLANDVLSKTQEQLMQRLSEPDVPFLEELLTKLCIEMKYDELDKLLNRLIGKVPDELNVGVRKPYVVRRPNGEEVEMGVKDVEGEE